MKYNVCGFSQQELVNLNLDITDALILDWFVYFCFSGNMVKETIDDRDYYWVKYQAVITDLPCINIKNKEVIARRFNKFVKCKLMDKKVIKTFNGTYSMFALNSDILNKLVSHPTLKSSEHTTIESDIVDSKVESAPDLKVEPKDNTISYSSINNNSNGKFKKPTIEELESYCKERNNSIDANYFFDYYEARGWILTNKQKMKNWQATIRTWERNNFSKKETGIPEFSEAG